MKILVRNLARTTTEAEVLELFQAHGKVEYCTLVLDALTGLSKGFGFVEMPEEDAAKAAIEQLNGQLIAESKIRVKQAESKIRAKRAE
jgi:RNA recognition motif-containing protein